MKAKPQTKKLWAKQDQHTGDRLRLFQTISQFITPKKVLYPGSYVDIAPSFSFDDVTYCDVDKRAKKFFEDTEGVRSIIDKHNGSPTALFEFIASDYYSLTLKEKSVDLMISLYGGFISEACAKYLKIGGLFLVNSSHGDAALTNLDSRFKLIAVVKASSGQYNISQKNIDSYMIPKKPQEITVESIKQSGRGVAYTKAPFAYLFERIE